MNVPPGPWSERMQAQYDVFMAYVEAEVNIAERVRHTVKSTKERRDVLAQLRAARLQSDAANEQMWIIHTEEEKARAAAAR